MDYKRKNDHIFQKARSFAGRAVLSATLMGCAGHRQTEVTVVEVPAEGAPLGREIAEMKEPQQAGSTGCKEPPHPRPGDLIPECARRLDYYGIPEGPYDNAARARLEEVRRRYSYMVIEPNEENGTIRGVFMMNSRYGSGDTQMWGWFEYISTGVKP